ncbi:MAG TPA: hypothetical protein VKB50_19740 [Vicinamibacterales bacterium]|nr:hypothetical protein [Vicinamibacterales bacterium]
MIDRHARPSGLATILLRAMLRQADIESIPGDLLEEYREVKRPSLGRLRADVWYVSQVLSVLWRLIWPWVVMIGAVSVLSRALPRGWNPGLVPAPGVSVLDAVVLCGSGCYGAMRAGRVVTGLVTAVATSLVGFTLYFVYAAITRPSLLLAPFSNPFIFVILATLLLIASSFGVGFGLLGALAGRWWHRARRITLT